MSTITPIETLAKEARAFLVRTGATGDPADIERSVFQLVRRRFELEQMQAKIDRCNRSEIRSSRSLEGQ